ncbi:hypothetical protein QTG56_02130 [Rossellomorea sp. AcN35-11]|nr:hypothetical protein QTG56_02130 [Rossellomorea sp. AcN35-11]
MNYVQRVKEIQRLQWELMVDYWFLHLGMVIVGVGIMIVWILKK